MSSVFVVRRADRYLYALAAVLTTDKWQFNKWTAGLAAWMAVEVLRKALSSVRAFHVLKLLTALIPPSPVIDELNFSVPTALGELFTRNANDSRKIQQMI